MRRRRNQPWWVAVAALLLAITAPARGSSDVQVMPLTGFVDDLGRRIDDAAHARPLRLIVFGYTHCPDVCPLTLAGVHLALVELGARAELVDPVFVTVDPERDSVAVLHGYVSAFDSRIRGYRIDAALLQQFADTLRVRYWREATGPLPSDYGMSHTATLFLVRRDGRLAARIPHDADPRRLARAILSAVNSASPPTAPGR